MVVIGYGKWLCRVVGYLAFAAAIVGVRGSVRADQLNEPYIDPTFYTSVPFGAHSHWAQPWRSYLETTSAAVFVDGTGIVFNVDARQADNVAAMLAKHGIRHARVEINWGSFAYDAESRLDDPAIAPKLQALRHYGIRPLILLNANSSRPCPLRVVRKTIARFAARGTQTLQLDTTDGLRGGYSGIAHVGEPSAGIGRILVTSVATNTVTLAGPLPNDIAAGTSLDFVTFKYRPFSNVANPDALATIKGWQTYAINVARIVRTELGTTGMADGGFDIEIWNELTFGSSFLSIDNYDPSAAERESGPIASIWGQIVAATATAATSRPDLFSGVQLGDGFANTTPWPASASEPAGISAIDKHPYAARNFPADEQKGIRLNAALHSDTYIPTYRSNFPEYFATFIQTDTSVRDMGPITGNIGKMPHGRNARVVNGMVAPVPVWITEVNTSPVAADPGISAAAASTIKEKTTARYFTFFLNKGVTQLDLYAASATDTSFGIVSDRFLQYAQTAAPYPADDTPYVSPALRITGRIAAAMSDGLDRTLTHPRALHVDGLASPNNRVIWRGDGTAAHPDLRAIDVFAFLPFQVNAHRFVIPFYVMTRDVMTDWGTDIFDLTVAGFSSAARFATYDPVRDTTVAVASTLLSNGTRLHLEASDYPKLLVVQEP